MAQDKADLTIPSEKFIHYSFREEDIVGGDGRLLPKLFGTGSGMRRFATPQDQALRAGFTRVRPGQGFKTYFWYKEIWYVIGGNATMDVRDKRSGEKQTVKLTAKDAVYYPEGVRIHLRNETDEDFYFLYCAVPASRRDAPWLAAMDEEDLNDVRVRQEY
ncbi:MAG: cupin domain-containing protein [Candidatus Dormibacteraeota bacterium]|uniref:Cupin domain-containing protein n=1 Tax=Candidatus Dormiibacter inghamiae TaxID=3127013 RepID=A0A934K503_9BACT|nr:cupin domain-containing protein [Candidatus Dormibacteraeota bacterium]MBJ7605288.1 cupin domain-containing protein [Candidatus Dormibacteraeota bacterium]